MKLIKLTNALSSASGEVLYLNQDAIVAMLPSGTPTVHDPAASGSTIVTSTGELTYQVIEPIKEIVKLLEGDTVNFSSLAGLALQTYQAGVEDALEACTSALGMRPITLTQSELAYQNQQLTFLKEQRQRRGLIPTMKNLER